MPNSEIQITVLDDRRADECGAGCGIDWSSPESLILALEVLGDKVKFEYVNLAMAASDVTTLKWREEIKKKSLSVPLLLINGHLRISGPFDMRQLTDAIEIEKDI